MQIFPSDIFHIWLNPQLWKAQKPGYNWTLYILIHLALFIILNFLLHLFICVYACMWRHVCHAAWVETRGQVLETASLPPGVLRGLNSFAHGAVSLPLLSTSKLRIFKLSWGFNYSSVEYFSIYVKLCPYFLLLLEMDTWSESMNIYMNISWCIVAIFVF